MHFFLTGDIQIGKSTIISKTLNIIKEKNSDYKISGFFTKGEEIDVFMYYAATGERFCIGKRGIGGYTEVFNKQGLELLKTTEAEQKNLILMDEIGWMEKDADAYSFEILKILDGETPVLGVFRKDCDTKLIEEIKKRSDVKIIEITKSNRDILDLASLILSQK